MFTNPIKRVIMKYAFSGHESFQCKGLWLKKGYDYAKAGLSFTDDYAVVELGVGKNMVASIRYWLRAFGITNDNGVPTEIGKYLLDDNGADPYIEDTATLWLLHYMLVTSRVPTPLLTVCRLYCCYDIIIFPPFRTKKVRLPLLRYSDLNFH